mmetsp:Transcript_208/g.696  ORF Transcript_208/g.696 Transcript_208/m.696 type:complete len:821 (-) Transcript_208:118-2580(-)
MAAPSAASALAKAEQPPTASFGEEPDLTLTLLPGWCLEVFQRRIQGVVDGYLCSHDVDEVVSSLREVSKDHGQACLEEMIVCIVNIALERSPEQRKLLSELLPRLEKEGVVNQHVLTWGFAKLASTWEELAVDDGPLAPPELVKMIVTCTDIGCLDRSFLRKLPQALLQSVIESGSETLVDSAEELSGIVQQMQDYRAGVDAAKLLQRRARPVMGVFVGKVIKVLRELGIPELRHEYVKWVLSVSLEWPQAERCQILAVLTELRKQAILSQEDMQWAVIRLLGQLNDLSLDNPDIASVATEQLRELMKQGLIEQAFLKKCKRLRFGDAAGIAVLEDLWPDAEGEVSSSSSPPQKSRDDKIEVETQQDDKMEVETQQEDAADGCAAEPAESEDTSGDVSTTVPTEGAPKSEADESEAHEEPLDTAPAAASTAPPASASSAGISLRPGGATSLTVGGLSLRPGGGGGLAGLLLQPPVAASSSKPAQQSQSGEKGEKHTRSRGGKGSGRGGAPKEDAGSGGWRRDAVKTQQKRQEDGGKKEIRPTENVPLVVTEESWVAQQRKRKEEGVSKLTNEEVLRRMRSILNKLTMDKFDDLYEQLIMESGIATEQHVRMLMVEVFEKATTQHHFVGMYTNMCVRLSTWFKEHVDIGDFKGILLDQCQASFSANMQRPPELAEEVRGKTADEQDELELKRHKWKLRMVGNVKLVGQLLVQELVKSKVLIICAEELLASRTADAMELLASLLTTVGLKFDVPSWRHHDALCKVFVQVKGLAQDPKVLGSRPRCLLQDVLDLRAQGWEDKRAVAKQAAVPRARNTETTGAS